MSFMPYGTQTQVIVLLIVLILNVEKSITYETKKTGLLALADLSGSQESSVRGGRKLQRHISRLKQVNGAKYHNIFNTYKDIGPLVYINNPVEAKLPKSYYSVDGFKQMLIDRVEKLREESMKKTNTPYSYTGKAVPTRTMNRGRIQLKHIMRKGKSITNSGRPSVKFISRTKKGTNLTHLRKIHRKNHHNRTIHINTHIPVRPALRVPTAHLNEELIKSYNKSLYRGTETPTVTELGKTTIHLNEELKKSHIKIIHRDTEMPAVPVPRIIHDSDNPENKSNSDFGENITKNKAKDGLATKSSSETEDLTSKNNKASQYDKSASSPTSTTESDMTPNDQEKSNIKPIRVDNSNNNLKEKDELRTIELTLTSIITHSVNTVIQSENTVADTTIATDLEHSHFPTEAEGLNTEVNRADESSNVTENAKESSIVASEAEESSTAAKDAEESNNLAKDAKESSNVAKDEGSSTLPTETETETTNIATTTTTLRTKRTRLVFHTLRRPNVFGKG